jgi:hypothetical protein
MNSIRRIIIILAALLPVTFLVSSASWAETKLDATIFSFDGKDFVRTNTTLMDKGQPATNTIKIEEISAFRDDPKIDKIIRALQKQIAQDSYRLSSMDGVPQR